MDDVINNIDTDDSESYVTDDDDDSSLIDDEVEAINLFDATIESTDTDENQISLAAPIPQSHKTMHWR